MKYLLILYMCSMINNSCPTSTVAGYQFVSHYDCVNAGYAVAQKTFRNLEALEEWDQTYINKNKDKFEYSLLPLNSFPNGAHYYQYFNDIDPYIIHFNYVIGEKKKQLMKEHGEWYI